MAKLLAIVALFVLAVPAAVAAPPDGKGKPNDKPVRAQSSSQATQNAAKQCKAERQSMGAEAFATRYGTNANKRNAFGKCVSQKAKAQVEAQQERTQNAAKLCKAERQSMGAEAFATRYGTNANKRNAFGKCVSQKAKPTS